jgi:hypothetical protein
MLAFFAILSLGANFEYQWAKNGAFSHVLRKVVTYFLPISTMISLIPTEISKSIKLRPSHICIRNGTTNNRVSEVFRKNIPDDNIT